MRSRTGAQSATRQFRHNICRQAACRQCLRQWSALYLLPPLQQVQESQPGRQNFPSLRWQYRRVAGTASTTRLPPSSSAFPRRLNILQVIVAVAGGAAWGLLARLLSRPHPPPVRRGGALQQACARQSYFILSRRRPREAAEPVIAAAFCLRARDASPRPLRA